MSRNKAEIEALAKKNMEKLLNGDFKRLRLPNDATPFYPNREETDYVAIQDVSPDSALFKSILGD